MEVVEKAVNFPGVCVFTRDSEGPFLDTDTYLNARDLDGVDPYAYISVQKVIDMGRVVGCLPPEEAHRLTEEVAALREQVAELEPKATAWDALAAAKATVEAAA